MKKEVLTAIVTALNRDVPLAIRKADLREIFRQRRGNNRKTILTVMDILSEHVLPLRHDEDFHGYFLKNISDPVYNNLKLIWDQSTCPYYTAVAGELLWNHYHDKNLAERALNAYSVELIAPTIENEYMFTHISLSICRILKKYKSPTFDFALFYKRCIQYVHEHADESGFCILFILRGLIACGINVDESEEVYLSLIDRFRANKNYSRAIAFEEDWEKYCKQLKQPRVEIQRKLAEDYERDADQYNWDDPTHAHLIIKQIQSAMNVWSRINNGEESKHERKRLAKKIENVKRLVLQSGQVISGDPVDISDFVDQLKAFVKTATLEEIVLELSNIVAIMNPESVMKGIQRSGPSLSELFPTTLLDSQGRKICIIPSALDTDPEKQYNRLTYNAKQRYQVSIDMAVQRYLHIAKEKVQFTKDNLRFLVDNNVFIPPDRRDGFLTGIQAGFELNLPLAMHVLMPQVENAVRVLAEDCGAVVYKTAIDGTEECLSMDSILNLPEVRSTLDDEFLFNLQLFFTSVYGFGMRNIIAHGLESDKELQSLNSLAVWWYTLHLCCIYCPELYKRVHEVWKSKVSK